MLITGEAIMAAEQLAVAIMVATTLMRTEVATVRVILVTEARVMATWAAAVVIWVAMVIQVAVVVRIMETTAVAVEAIRAMETVVAVVTTDINYYYFKYTKEASLKPEASFVLC
jgi:hypothetical protein